MSSASPDFHARQRFILRAGGSAVAVTLAVGALLVRYVVPPPSGPVDTAARLVLAARCVAIASVPLAVLVFVVMRTRLWSGAHDPLLGQESPRLRIHIRVLQNTTEQLALFAAGACGCAVGLPPHLLGVLPAATLLFLVGRALFWWGYLRPGFVLARAPGVGVTVAVTFPLVVTGAWLALSPASPTTPTSSGPAPAEHPP